MCRGSSVKQVKCAECSYSQRQDSESEVSGAEIETTERRGGFVQRTTTEEEECSMRCVGGRTGGSETMEGELIAEERFVHCGQHRRDVSEEKQKVMQTPMTKVSN